MAGCGCAKQHVRGKIEFKRLPIIYCASPYSAKNTTNEKIKSLIEETRAIAITQIIGKLEDKHECAFIGPITQSHHTGQYRKKRDGAFEQYKNIDLTYISICDEVWVVMLPGWEESVGVTTEVQFANEKGIPVKYINPETLRFKKPKTEKMKDEQY